MFKYARCRMQTNSIEKVIFHLKNTKMSNADNLDLVVELKMYSNLLKSGNIYHNNHTTTFADLLLKYVPGLNKKVASKRVSLFFETAGIGLNKLSETYFDKLVKISGPVSEAMHQKCQELSS